MVNVLHVVVIFKRVEHLSEGDELFVVKRYFIVCDHHNVSLVESDVLAFKIFANG